MPFPLGTPDTPALVGVEGVLLSDPADITDLTRACASPLAVAAAPVLAFATRLHRLVEPVDVARLHAAALEALHEFVRAARDLGLPADALALSQVAVAALLDDAVLDSDWGALSDWPTRLVVSAIAPGHTGDSFYEGLERMLDASSAPRAVLELAFVCLSLGLSGRCWQLADASARRDGLRERLWRMLGGGGTTVALSPEWAGLAAPPAVQAGGLSAWWASLLRRPSADEALIDGLARNPVDADDVFGRLAQERLAEGLAMMSASLRRRRQSLTRLPWYAVIGPPGAGKTSALRNAGLDFPLSGRFGVEPLASIGGTRHCEFWFTDRAIFFDMAGRYALQDSDAGRDSAEWHAFLAVLKRTRPNQPLNGVILIVSTTDLLMAPPEHRRLLAEAIRARLIELQERFQRTLPAYVVITKLDLVYGFESFYDSLDVKTREQILGLTLPREPDQAGAAPRWQFLPRFDRLARRQREFLADRLWHERDGLRRALIHEFPGQFASLGRILDEFFARAFDSTALALAFQPRGVYFTSAKQVGMPIDRWTPLAASTMQLATSPPPYREEKSGRAFFLHKLYGELIPGEAGLVATLPPGPGP